MRHDCLITLPSRRILQAALGATLLLCGCAVYLLFRSKTIRLYQWCAWAGLSEPIDALRTAVAGWPLADVLRYSLPDGLYCTSYILLMDAVWAGGGRIRYCAVALMPLVAVAHELAQLAGIAPGTFDVADLLCYALPLTVYFAVVRLRSKENEEKKTKNLHY